MFSTADTVVAIATPPGHGGLGVVRISGPGCRAIATAMLDRDAPLRPRHATLTRVRGIDQAVATLFAAPHSYTGEDVVEISAHGSPVVLRAIVEAAIGAGARLAEPGEFTLRAFLNGRVDLVQAEAIADLIEAVTPLQARAAFDQLEGTLTARIGRLDAALFDLVARLEASLDFPDEGYHFIEPAAAGAAIRGIAGELDALLLDARRGRLIREGAEVVIVGRTNAGKSSVFNRLAGHARAIVADIPGTTRDLVTERVDILGIPVTLVDTAGIRVAENVIEQEGVARARQAMDVATLVLVVLDSSRAPDEDDRRVLTASAALSRVIVANKADLPLAWDRLTEADAGRWVTVSARTGEGFEDLRSTLVTALASGQNLRDTPSISNVRHIALLEAAAAGLARAIDAAEGGGAPEEFVLADLQQARTAFEEITGRRTTDDMLRHIFERFCVGK